MNFYQEWANVRKDNMNDTEYVLRFLDYDIDSITPLLSGDKYEIVHIVQLLLSIPIEDMVTAIDHKYNFSSKDVFQYSKLNDAIVTICNLLEFEHDHLSFVDAGRIITHAQNEYACIKYGENHLKLASALSLVDLEKDIGKKGYIASITALGSVSTAMDTNSRIQLVRRLAIRNAFVKSLLFCAKSTPVEYKNLASEVLSGQTIVRRKHNVEIIVKLILGDHPIENNIRW
jgi:hypothetical protein